MNREDLQLELILYVNGNLTQDRRAELETALAADPELLAESGFLSSLHAGIRDDTVVTPGEYGLARLKRSIQADRRAARTNWWRPAAIAVSVLLIAQTTLMLIRAPEETIYAPLSGTTVTEDTLQVMFSAGATEEQIRRALQAVDATFVDGPGATGLYRVRLSAARGSPEYARAVDALRARDDVVTYISEE